MTIALVDVNACYCSAEILFRPWLRDKAVVVASNNDGNIVSRNDAAKRLGIKMGQPVFEIRDLVARGELYLFSSNYELYQSLSNRIMAVLEELAPGRVSVFSIDEMFCDLGGVADPEAWGRMAQEQVLKRVGMPVGVGIAPTKTLAKLANYAAKKWKAKTGCVVDLRDPVKQEKLMRYAPVADVWGIGSRISTRLVEDLNIKTAWDLAAADPKLLRRVFNVNVERTCLELQGITCFQFYDGTPERKQMIASTRSFGEKVFALEALEQAVAAFTTNAAAKLRKQRSLANCIQVFARTSGFGPGPQYGGSRIVVMPFPTDDTRDLVQGALAGLREFFKEGPAYAKAGVVLSQFEERGAVTGDMFAPSPRKGSEQVMAVLDAINAKQGRGSIRLARDTSAAKWSMRRDYLSAPYTTSWAGLQRAFCK